MGTVSLIATEPLLVSKSGCSTSEFDHVDQGRPTYKVRASSRSALEFQARDRASAGHKSNPDACFFDKRAFSPCLCKPTKRWGVRNRCDHDVIGRDVEQQGLSECGGEHGALRTSRLLDQGTFLASSDDAAAIDCGDYVPLTWPRVHPDGLVVAPVSASSRVPSELRLPDLLPSDPSHEAADVEDERIADLDASSIDRDACHRS